MADNGPKPKKKRKMRLSLKQNKMKKVDTYTDSLGWSTDVGRTLTDAPESKAPDTLTVQCTMCGSMLKIPKPKKASIQFLAHIQNVETPWNSEIRYQY